MMSLQKSLLPALLKDLVFNEMYILLLQYIKTGLLMHFAKHVCKNWQKHCTFSTYFEKTIINNFILI
jgi:hypothetical protein